MAAIGPRLASLFEKVRPEVALPVIVVTSDAPSPELVSAIAREAGGVVTFRSSLGHAVGVRLTADAASRVARLPGVRAVQYDEPIVSIRSFLGW